MIVKHNPILTTLLVAVIFLSLNDSKAQIINPSDSIHGMKYIKEITLIGEHVKHDVIQLPEIAGTHIYAGKKNSLVLMDNLNTVVVNNNMRQIFAKIPGIHIWESDGSGIQIGIAARGLSPNRSWEFNIRQNGCDIAADPFGYPEAYYNPQMQAIQRIQVVRGAGALQYGPQFGGMINYVMRDGSDIHKPIQLEAQQSVGSFGLLNSFLAIGGEYKKWHYYAFYDSRKANGWRQNSQYETQTAFASLTYYIGKKMQVNAEYMHYTMESQQPGGLTDAEFNKNANISSRARNWFATPWTTASIKYNWEINSKNRFQAKIYSIAGDRKSVGFMAPINVKDSINASLLSHNPREVAIDLYRNIAAELGYLKEYKILGKAHTLSIGARYFKGNTLRLQKGTGTTGVNADYSIKEAKFPTDIEYNSNNYAVYAENVFRLGKKLLVIPGTRFENIAVAGDGVLSTDKNGNETRMKNETRTRSFLLGGIGIEYHVGKKHHTEIYGNITQAYRPILFSNITSPTTDIVDPEMKDSKGWNADFGFRGLVGNFLNIDASVYYLQYNDRIGTVTRLNNNQSYRYITNLGNTHSYGLEGLLDIDIISKFMPSFSKRYGSLPLFVSYNYNQSEYEDYKIIAVTNNQEVESNLKGKIVEYAPKHILRTGLSYKFKNLHITFQGSYTSKTYSDATNTLEPTANGQAGLIPSFTVYDLMIGYNVNRHISLKMSINNLSNEKYFTRRAGGYPGPGILPSDARSILVNAAIKI